MCVTLLLSFRVLCTNNISSERSYLFRTMADLPDPGFTMPEGLSQDQQHQIRLAIEAAEARGRTAQLEEDKSILEDAREHRRDAARLRYAFMLRHRCKTEYRIFVAIL